eukprot:201513-Pyramimonas_sp.AAC.1
MTTAGSFTLNKLSDRIPVAGCGPSETAAASPAGGIATAGAHFGHCLLVRFSQWKLGRLIFSSAI